MRFCFSLHIYLFIYLFATTVQKKNNTRKNTQSIDKYQTSEYDELSKHNRTAFFILRLTG